MALFQNVEFTGHSGQPLAWKIECDALTPEDWAWTAARVAERVSFCGVQGIPEGGLVFAEKLARYMHKDGKYFLLVDDVLTTGGSMIECRQKWLFGAAPVLGVVLFARIPPPEPWIKALFTLDDWKL